MRIAVTGGAGFIGRATVDAATRAGHQAWSFDRSDGNDILGSLSDLEGAEAIVHLAGVLGTAELFDDPDNAVCVNVLGTLRILQWCQRNQAAYVGITMPDVFPSVYTATKICAMRLATAWHRAYGVPVSHVRAFNAYGPGQAYGPGHPQKILPTFAHNAWNNQPLPVWGDGEQTVDLVHTDDVAQLLVEACGHGHDEVIDAGTGVSVTVNQLAQVILDETGSTGGIEYLPMRLGEEPTRVAASGAGWDLLKEEQRPWFSWDRVLEVVRWYKP